MLGPGVMDTDLCSRPRTIQVKTKMLRRNNCLNLPLSFAFVFVAAILTKDNNGGILVAYAQQPSYELSTYSYEGKLKLEK